MNDALIDEVARIASGMSPEQWAGMSDPWRDLRRRQAAPLVEQVQAVIEANVAMLVERVRAATVAKPSIGAFMLIDGDDDPELAAAVQARIDRAREAGGL